MPLKKQKGNMYDWVTHTWNPIKGKCSHDCSYCYVKRWGELKQIRLDEKELKTDLGSDNFIFVGSGCDMFANDIPSKWVIETLNHCEKYNDNKYLFQTKNPKAFLDYAPSLCQINDFILCITMESNHYYPEVMNNSPLPSDRFINFSKIPFNQKMVTIEPIMKFDLELFLSMLKSIHPFQINIGADSGRNNLPEPSKEKVLELISELEKFTKVHLKKNLNRIIK